jgi:hypothetical protein
MSSLCLSCSHCGAQVHAEESQQGQRIACPECAAPVYVPSSPTVEATGDYHSSPSQPVGTETPHGPQPALTPAPSSLGSPPLDPAAPLFVIDDYVVLDELARGGMGIPDRAVSWSKR